MHIVATATVVQNKVAPGATWDGISDLPVDEATFQELVSDRESSVESAAAAAAPAPTAKPGIDDDIPRFLSTGTAPFPGKGAAPSPFRCVRIARDDEVLIRVGGMKTLLAALLVSAPFAAHAAAPVDPIVPGRDYHSYADPSAFRVKHLDLDLQTSFEDKRLSGVADLTITRVSPDASKLVLDTRDLMIRQHLVGELRVAISCRCASRWARAIRCSVRR